MQKDKMIKELEALLSRKRSNEWLAEKLNTTEEVIIELKREIRDDNREESIDSGSIIKTNLEKGTIEVNAYYDHPPTAEELIEDHRIDLSKYKLTGFWSKGAGEKGWLASAFFSLKKQKDTFQQEFINFLSTWETPHESITKEQKRRPPFDRKRSCLVFNKQDAHYNKYDINGKNDIADRFGESEDKVERILEKAAITSDIDKIIYIIGSDEFNSEWTSQTTKGTPQQNILPYQVSFQAICYHEVEIINKLLKSCDNLEILYIAGNHDSFAGWHMASWLKAYYREQSNLTIDISPAYSKYIKWSDTAMMYNHGCTMKPEKMAQVFPVDFKEHWSSCNNFYIFSGDKHTELTRDIGGIRFFRVAALSDSVSQWDSINGYGTKGEMTAFLIEDNIGMTDIYKM